GDATVVTVDFGWEMENGLTFDLGYAYQVATEVNPMTSSVANTNFTNRAVFDPNDEENSRSNYETEDRFTFGATWRREFVPGFQTLFSLFGEHRSGTPFSYTFFDVNNGTATQVSAAGFSARGLMYVPTGPSDPNVSYQASGSQTADQARDLLEQIINSSVLAGYRGTYAARNIGTSPDITTFDFRFSQELPGFFDGHRSIFFFDIENVGNLINPDWGLIEYPSFPRTATVADVVRGPQNADGEYTYIYRNVREPGFDQCPEVNNCRAAGFWQIQVGLRYQF
ncbi:MAG: TonB-dependent receptor, partial [Hyphomonadaceae bacterium]